MDTNSPDTLDGGGQRPNLPGRKRSRSDANSERNVVADRWAPGRLPLPAFVPESRWPQDQSQIWLPPWQSGSSSLDPLSSINSIQDEEPSGENATNGISLPVHSVEDKSSSFSQRNGLVGYFSDQLIDSLAPYFKETRNDLTGEDFDNISELLKPQKEKWSKTPRLFWLFCKVGKLNTLRYYDVEDCHLPLKSFPTFTASENRAFNTAQVTLYSESWIHGRHNFFADDENLPWTTITSKPCANRSEKYQEDFVTIKDPQSVVLRLFSRKPDRVNVHEIQPFMRTIRRLSEMRQHKHMPEYLGSYSSPTTIGILTPLTSCYLEAYLEDVTYPPGLVQSWFGCLASAVQYLHGQGIFHVSIEPSNIHIVERGNVPQIQLIDMILPDAQRPSPWLLPIREGYSYRNSNVWGLGMVYLLMLSKLTGLRSEYNTMTRCLDISKNPLGLIRGHIRRLIELSATYTGLTRHYESKLRLYMFVSDILFLDSEGPPNINMIAWTLQNISSETDPWCGRCCLLDTKFSWDWIWSYINSKKWEFTLEEIQMIARQLTFAKSLYWARSPRTFILVCQISEMTKTSEANLMSKFEAAGISDIWIPLKPSLTRQLVRELGLSDDLDKMQVELTSANYEDGEHNHLLTADDHFEVIEDIGSGGYGLVSHIIDNRTKRHLARKTIPRVHTLHKNRARDVTDVVEREINILKRVTEHRHRHLVSMVGSYTDLEDFGILFSPLADMNLADYMDTKPEAPNLIRWFLCLSQAMQFLHGLQIRHKDIKPQNILVHGENILLTDFGISNDWSSLAAPTTSGPGARDPQYCAPEVWEWDKRNKSADIFSLGCVYLEMITVLKGLQVADIREFFRTHGTEQSWYHRNEEALRLWIDHLENRDSITNAMDDWRTKWVRSMTHWKRELRVTSGELLKTIVKDYVERGICTSDGRMVSEDLCCVLDE